MLGTPWHHAARTPGVGLDCVGLVIVSLQNLGVPLDDMVNYGLSDEFIYLNETLDTWADCIVTRSTFVSGEELRPGDLIIFRGTLFAGRPVLHHMGVLVEDTRMVHANNDALQPYVVEEYIRPGWMKIFHSVWRYKNMVNDVS